MQVAWRGDSRGIGAGLYRILDINFREFLFHAVSILENGCGRRLGAA
jgi:hypothetical protein